MPAVSSRLTLASAEAPLSALVVPSSTETDASASEEAEAPLVPVVSPRVTPAVADELLWALIAPSAEPVALALELEVADA